MYFSTVLSALALAASASAAALGASSASMAAPGTDLKLRDGAQCPEQTNYCGWFDKVNNAPPVCKPVVVKPAPLPQPSCPSGQAAYCVRDPGHFCPYDATHEYCVNDGLGMCDCFDVHYQEDTIAKLLGDVFCTVDHLVEDLGLGCLLLNEPCPVDWRTLNLACTVAELTAFLDNAVCDVVDLVGGLLGDLL